MAAATRSIGGALSAGRVRILPSVAEHRAAGSPIVALESSVLAQGLPIPSNRQAAEEMSAGVIRGGAIPAITAVVRGEVTLGITDEELERFLAREGVRKVSSRDMPVAMAQKADGATTVAASLCVAVATGTSVFATGGIGGVHRDAPFDESGDLVELSRSPVVCVCAGAKSILDLPATLERLETLGVTVVGYGTDELPGFFTTTTGLRLTARADSPGEIADIFLASRALGRRQAILVVQPPPADLALPRGLVDGAVAGALVKARAAGISGARTTPFLLGAVLEATEGRSLFTNLGLLRENATLAGQIARELANRADTHG
ncbi:MAG: pseudouridine-5'-phosphate glycosidase [Gemmatimonadaceae bacterium]